LRQDGLVFCFIVFDIEPTLLFMFSYSTNPAKGSTQAPKGLQDDRDILGILFGQFFGK